MYVAPGKTEAKEISSGGLGGSMSLGEHGHCSCMGAQGRPRLLGDLKKGWFNPLLSQQLKIFKCKQKRLEMAACPYKPQLTPDLGISTAQESLLSLAQTFDSHLLLAMFCPFVNGLIQLCGSGTMFFNQSGSDETSSPFLTTFLKPAPSTHTQYLGERGKLHFLTSSIGFVQGLTHMTWPERGI